MTHPMDVEAALARMTELKAQDAASEIEYKELRDYVLASENLPAAVDGYDGTKKRVVRVDPELMDIDEPGLLAELTPEQVEAVAPRALVRKLLEREIEAERINPLVLARHTSFRPGTSHIKFVVD